MSTRPPSEHASPQHQAAGAQEHPSGEGSPKNFPGLTHPDPANPSVVGTTDTSDNDAHNTSHHNNYYYGHRGYQGHQGYNWGTSHWSYSLEYTLRLAVEKVRETVKNNHSVVQLVESTLAQEIHDVNTRVDGVETTVVNDARTFNQDIQRVQTDAVVLADRVDRRQDTLRDAIVDIRADVQDLRTEVGFTADAVRNAPAGVDLSGQIDLMKTSMNTLTARIDTLEAGVGADNADGRRLRRDQDLAMERIVALEQHLVLARRMQPNLVPNRQNPPAPPQPRPVVQPRVPVIPIPLNHPPQPVPAIAPVRNVREAVVPVPLRDPTILPINDAFPWTNPRAVRSLEGRLIDRNGVFLPIEGHIFHNLDDEVRGGGGSVERLKHHANFPEIIEIHLYNGFPQYKCVLCQMPQCQELHFPAGNTHIKNTRNWLTQRRHDDICRVNLNRRLPAGLDLERHGLGRVTVEEIEKGNHFSVTCIPAQFHPALHGAIF